LAKVFEKQETDEKERTYELCSIRGVYRLARVVEIHDIAAAVCFAAQHLYMMSRAIIETAHICSA